ncbi:mechanosensitive ion channel [Heliorestis acidaminivorans]|uniref:Mechanosensitive ion channel n=1 Tax=Heliorestis acidaminivorans TaxID=553427 RepID=A0A6I0ESF2_9FIRM|nr:mechanosensitive ion channel domain-containing protein [Heliorestis acidaminivorans]KAB2952715.1 mechanosensitive ion channel [Heliorestis acidaminivorans]
MKHRTLYFLIGLVLFFMVPVVLADGPSTVIGVYKEADSSEPVESEPAESEPTESEPAESEPAESEPTESEPAESEPAESEPAESEPAESEPAVSEQAESELAESEPAESELAESEPAESELAESEQAEIEQAEIEPAESEPAESEPAVSEPVTRLVPLVPTTPTVPDAPVPAMTNSGGAEATEATAERKPSNNVSTNPNQNPNTNRSLDVVNNSTEVTNQAIDPPTSTNVTRTVREVPEEEQIRSSVVHFNGEDLLTIRVEAGTISPQIRAQIIAERIIMLAKDNRFVPETLGTFDEDDVSVIMAGDFMLMTVTDLDGAVEGLTRQELATAYTQKIKQAIVNYRNERSTESLISGAIYAILATLIFFLFIRYSKKILLWIQERIERTQQERQYALRLKTLELLTPERITRILLKTTHYLRTLIILFLGYYYLYIVFSLFPWTRDLAGQLLEYSKTPFLMAGEWLLEYLPNFSIILLVIVSSFYLLKFIRYVFVQIAKGKVQFSGFYPDWAMPTYKIVRIFIVILNLIIIYPYLPGSDSPIFQGITVFLGLLFSLGSSSAISNVVAGVVLTYMRPFNLGDRVKIAETVGDIIEKNLLVTRMRTAKNEDITIPNIQVLNNHIVNYSSMAQKGGVILHTKVTIGYDIPWRTVHKLLIEAAEASPYVLPHPTPFVHQTSLDDYYPTYELNAYTNQPNRMAAVYSDIHQNIQDKFNEAGIEILSPQYQALRDGNQVTTPEGYLPSDYKAPRFRVENTSQQEPKLDFERNKRSKQEIAG